ncbi:MAG: polysaccharide biosynthesis tyrosine autokinase [Actinomycetia bacterium]|nr:polysaccharide biosynthesis tyrosine autokinase [Actinomycetes bacterium]
MAGIEEQSAQTPDLAHYLRVIRERAWIIVLVVVVVTSAMLILSYRSTPLYQASSKLLYQMNNLDSALFGSSYYSDVNETIDVATGAEMVKLPQVAEAVKQQLGSPRSAEELLEAIDVSSSQTTNIIKIDAVSTDPLEAAQIANAFAEQFTVLRRDTDRATVAAARELVKEKLATLDSEESVSNYGLMLKEKYENLQILEAMQDGGFTIVQTAVPAASPISPQPVRSGLIGLAVGLVLGLGLAFLLDYFDRRLKDTKAIEDAFGLPVLATVPTVGSWERGRRTARRKSFVGFRSHPELLESFRALRSSLQYFDFEKSIKTIAVTSGLPREGKTATTINLALSLVMAGHRVVIAEADLRRPMVPEYLRVDGKAGLSSVLSGATSLADALQPVDLTLFLPDEVRASKTKDNDAGLRHNLYCLASGPLPPNPAELLGSERMAKLIEEIGLNPGVDYLLIDTPPILAVADALTFAHEVDAVIVASRVNSTTRAEAQEVTERLRRSGARTIGVVAGGVRRRDHSYRRRSYYYTQSQKR